MRWLLLLLLIAPPATAAEITTIAGDWKCEYSARHATDRMKTSSMWFTVTLLADGTYDGNGKSIAVGISTPSRLHGDWAYSSGTLKMTGHTDGPFGKLPFRFEADAQTDGELRRKWTKGKITQTTRCLR